MPLNMRMVEPEFPQSSGVVEAESAEPRPSISITFAASSARVQWTPKERRQPNVLAQSTPVE